MTFDSNRAWKQAARLVSANRDVLIALSGVFFLLPSFAFALLLPQPQPAPGIGREEAILLMRDYYVSVLPFIIPMLLFQALGTLAAMTLFSDRARPTVGESLRLALLGLGPYLAAQLLVGLVVGAFAGVLGLLAAFAGSKIVLAVVLAILVVLLTYVWVKTSLIAPAIAVEHARNPIAALTRSWRLTRHHSVRIAVFYLLIAVTFSIVVVVTMSVIGIVLALIAQATVATVVSAFVSSMLSAGVTVYFIAVLAAVHRQLIGAAADAEAMPPAA